MSRASKITLATTIVATTVTVIWVHKVQEEERNVSIDKKKESSWTQSNNQFKRLYIKVL